MPKPVEFSRSVATAGGAHAAGTKRVVALHSARRFDLVGAEWRGGRGTRVELRTRLGRGRWSRWADASADGDGPDTAASAAARGKSFSAPIWVGGADRIELRLSRPVAGLRLHFVNTTGSATDVARAKTASQVKQRGAFGSLAVPATHAAAPPIIPRSKWGASRCKARVAPAFGSVRVAYVHHTESINGYSRSRAASIVLGICLFHRNTRGWNDIGYDFLVDRYGDIFEGRAGGATAPVIGAQAGGFNSESTGVSMIGSFTRSAPPRAAMNALTRLLAWKLALHGVPAQGRVRVTSAGGPNTAYRAGTKVTVNRISGHRDVDQTDCPGAALYARLPALRRAVARREGPISALTIGPFTQTVPSGAGVPVSGRLTLPGGASAGGATVELRRFAGFGEAVVGSATVAADGSWATVLPPPPANSSLRAVFLGDGRGPGVVSGTAYVRLGPPAPRAP